MTQAARSTITGMIPVEWGEIMGVPYGCYWGVDSLIPINFKIGGAKTLYEVVKEKTGATPSFWGRYIGKHNGKNALSEEEVAYVAKANPSMRLLLVYNKVRPGGDKATGQADAQVAILAANELKVADSVVIYANVEPKDGKVTADWMVGWWTAMNASRFGSRGGIYGNTSSTFWATFLGPAYEAAIKAMPSPGRDPALWAQHPFRAPKAGDAIDFPYMPDSLPAQMGDPVVWQYAINLFKPQGSENGLIDMDLANQSGMDGMWYVGAQRRSGLTDEEMRNLIAPPT
jgi:hypothetical protein